MTYLEAAMIAEFNDDATYFAREQAVQYAIALIQKASGASIFDINELAIRHAVARGMTPAKIAQQYVPVRVKES
jgi:hypothetical protein